jgi:hypothetical protein
MKIISRIFTVLLILVTVSCLQEDVFTGPAPMPETLILNAPVGLALESHFIQEDVKMNVKVEAAGSYVLRIHHLDGRTVAKEDISVSKGDNLKVFFVGALPRQPYTLALYTTQNVKLTQTIINLY